ncbi:MAG: ATP-binding protein [Actinobacteria bacterium]|nr:ATP-binding protein [Actinomycetota bacterium]
MSVMVGKEYASRDIDAQLRYMEAFYKLLRMRENAWRMREGMAPEEGPRGGTGPSAASAGSPAPGAGAEMRRLERAVSSFEARLKESPQRYPLEAFCRAHRLNALERFMVTAVASITLYGEDHDGLEAGMEVRRLARLYHHSPRKRLEAEFYFTRDCKLLQSRILRLCPREPGTRGGPSPAGHLLAIRGGAYRALMGRDRPGPDRARREGLPGPEGRDDGEGLGELLEPRVGLERVVLPPETLEEIRSALVLERNREVLFGSWGLGEQAPRGRGVSMLFFGPPGTGKTMAAEAVARELGRKLLWVSGSDLVSKWHGEEERRTAAVFRRARAEEAVLLFDEADSFFYARHGVSHSTDVADNRAVNVILGCLEDHALPVVLTTNRADALDPALERRLTLKVAFGVPGPEERERIWRLHLPSGLPLAEDVDVARLARVYELAGGNIRNAVVTAARRAIARAGDAASAVVAMRDLERACRDECEGGAFSAGGRRKVGFLA